MVQMTYYPPAEPDAEWRQERPQAAVTARGLTEVRYGYTLDHLHNIARKAVNASLAKAMDYADRLEAAWSGVIDLLLTSEERPSSLALIQAGESAIRRLISDEYRHHGYAGRDGYAGAESGRNYQRYWWTTPTASPENWIVDRAALRQILPQLTPRQQEAITALAATGDYWLAAASMGITADTYRVTIANARKAFFVLWHEGETPSRMWGTDRRVGRRGATEAPKTKRRAPTRAVTRRTGRTKHELVHGKASTYANHACRCEPCREAATEKAREYNRNRGASPRRRITVSQLADIRVRYEVGETLTAIGAELGFANSYLSRLLSGVRKPAPDPDGVAE